jgi:hypothetical protein
VCQLLNVWTNLYETRYVLDTWAHLNGGLHKSLPSVCVSVCVSHPIVARQQIGKHFPTAKNTRNNRSVGRVVFYAVRVVIKESLWACLCNPLSLLGNGSIDTFTRQQILCGVFLYAARVVLRESSAIGSSQNFLFYIHELYSVFSVSRKWILMLFWWKYLCVFSEVGMYEYLYRLLRWTPQFEELGFRD